MEELHHTLSSAEYQRWLLYWEVEPWGSFRDNIHAGQIASAIWNARPGKKQKLAKATDFLLRDKEEAAAGTTKQALQSLRLLATKRRKRTKVIPNGQ